MNLKWVTLAASPHYWSELARKTEVPIELLIPIYQNPNCPRDVKWELARREDAPPEWMAEQIANVEPETPLYLRVVQEITLTQRVFEVLVRVPSEHLTWAVSHNPTATAEQLNTLLTHPETSATAHIGAHPNISADSLDRLSRHASIVYRKAVVANLMAPPQILLRLSQDAAPAVRAVVANNPRTPAAALYKLSQDSQRETRENAMTNPSTPKSAVFEAAKDPTWQVRLALTRHPALLPAERESLLLAVLPYMPQTAKYDLAWEQDLPPTVLVALTNEKAERTLLRLIRPLAKVKAWPDSCGSAEPQ